MSTRTISAIARGAAGECVPKLVGEIRTRLSGDAPALIFVLAPAGPELPELSGGLAREFEGTRVIGIGTSRDDVRVQAIAGDVSVQVGLGTLLRMSAQSAVSHALFRLPLADPKRPHRAAIVIRDPLGRNQDETDRLLRESLGGPVDRQIEAPQVSLEGRGYSDALALALIFSSEPVDLAALLPAS